MTPVQTLAVDYPVNETGQVAATIITFAAAAIVIMLVARICVRERIVWPVIVLAGGTITCLFEPLFDHLYGLWFPSEGWTLFRTFGVHAPIWLPAAYLAVYGGGAVFIARRLQGAPRDVMRVYWIMVVVAIVAEIAYIKIFESYNYQDRQPFVVLGYPLFLGFVNAMAALVAGIVLCRLQPMLHGASQLALVAVVPLAFAADLFGAGILYLSVRHSGEPFSDLLVHLSALAVVLGVLATVRLTSLLLPEEEKNPVVQMFYPLD